MQQVIVLAKAGGLIHVRRANQPTIKTVAPGVVRTLNHAAVSTGFLQQSGAPMTTNITVCPDLTLPITDNDQAFTGDFAKQIVTRIRNLTLVPEANPFAGKNPFSFRSEELGRNKIFLRQRHCSRGEGLGRFAKTCSRQSHVLLPHRQMLERRFQIVKRLPLPCSELASSAENCFECYLWNPIHRESRSSPLLVKPLS